MEVAFLTNYLTHHQTPFCETMYEKLGEKFHLIVMRTTGQERKKLGYEELNDKYPFVVKVYEGREEEALEICRRADVVIWGSAPEKFTRDRLQKNKLTFIYTERIFKKGAVYALHPLVMRNMYNKYTANRNKQQYYLCASAYTASDINPYVHTPEKFFKWGYFPKTEQYADVDMLIAKKHKNSLVWVGRFIELKHPELPIEVAKRLKQEGYTFELNMLGNGVMLDAMKALVEKYDLADCVHILGAKPSGEVRKYMEEAEIHLFTSDRNEGWGAVVNEAMNSACAVVANRKIGSVPFLIKNGENGFAYKNQEDLYQKVKFLLDHSSERKTVCRNAYATIVEQWNAETATDRLLVLINSLLDGKENCRNWTDGPCSRAVVKK